MKEHKDLVIPSGHAQGKDWICGSVVPWFLYNYYPSKVIITAPTDRQVREIIWGEIESRWNTSLVKLDGRLLSCKIDIAPDHFAIGFTTKETGNMTGKFQGFHSPNILVIASEAQAIPDKIYEQIEGILTSANSLLIMIGNPLSTSGKFARAIKNTTTNIVISLSVLDSPNYKERREVIPGMASYEWVEKKRIEWTEESPLWFARVLGQLPPTGIDSVFSPEVVEKMIGWEPRVVLRKKVVSVDPARFGDDDCVIYGNMSGRPLKSDIMPMSSGDKVCSRTLQMRKYIDANHITVDSGGLGGPICDFLRKMLPEGVYLEEVDSNGKPDDKEHYWNRRAEMWMYAKKEAEEGREAIPNDKFLIEELLEVKYFFNRKGKIQIEKKEDIKERLGRSPNRADAWILNVWGRKSAQVIHTKGVWDEKGPSHEVGVVTKSAMSA